MTATEHGFKAEVVQLLDLMVHSLYSDREIFVRELVSNAADALDRARFLALSRSDLVPAADGEPGIRITVDASAGTLVFEDDGVGMSEADVVENLGTIAHSGSKAFLRSLQESKDKPSFIGQFGVGFYSAFMVADRVVVTTRSAEPGHAAVAWASEGKGTYTVEPGEREVRGTRIELHLREDATEFADAQRLSNIVRRYSNHIPWPVRVDGNQANAAKALWLEPPSQVTETEAAEFYRSIAFDWQDPAARIHVSVDSPIQYTALLFVPSHRPMDLFQPEVDRGPRLYARRVLIAEHAKELLPDWLRFVKGVVSSEDIALNVSREMVQKTPVVRKIKDALTKRILKELGEIAAQAPEGDAPPRYRQIWRDFGALLKEGVYHERGDIRERIVPLLRFHATSREADDLISLADYKAAMPEGQDAIWYLCAPSREQALASPHLEAFRKRGWDVLLLVDSVDEWFVQELGTFDDVPLKSVARGELALDEESAERADLDGLAPWLTGVLGDTVAGVRKSSRLTDSPCVLVDDEHGISSNMEKLLEQARAGEGLPKARRWLELNAGHPLIMNLARLHDGGRTDMAEPLARLLLDDALLLEGTVKEPASIGRRLQALLERAAATAAEGIGG